MMKYITTFFWTAILGAVVGYIGGALQNVKTDYNQAMITALIAGSIGTILTYYISRNNALKMSDADEEKED